MPVQAALARFLVKWRFAPVGALVLLSSSVRVVGARVARASRRTYAVYVAIAMATASSCGEIDDPFPTPLPANLTIAPTPAVDARVAPSALHSVQLDFDRPMDPTSVHRVLRVSFLLPVALHDLDGRWSADNEHVAFDLTEFPIQPGALYEASFVGLRMASGELYNGGPFDLRFATTGEPDLFPLRPHARIATRSFCHRDPASRSQCTDITLHADSTGVDSVRVHSTCEDCVEARDDWYRGTQGRIDWLGWDVLDLDERVTARVRWPQPLPLVRHGSRAGETLVGAPQSTAAGVELLRWRTVNQGVDSPSHALALSEGTVTVVYSRSTVLAVVYALRLADGDVETHDERWWLLPGVGLVRRETTVQHGDAAPVRSVDTFVPSLTNLGQ